MRAVLLCVLAGALAITPAVAPPAANRSPHEVPATPVYAAPLAGPLRVVRAFAAPPTPYAAGHRGVDLASRPGQAVHAAAAGRVSFAGPVAGRGVVVVSHPDGVSTEYEPVRVAVRRGQQVARGEVIGHVRGHHGRCRPGHCLHWGARRDGHYIDPLTLLRPLPPVRLLPWSASPGRPRPGSGPRMGLGVGAPQPLD